jgi:prolyl-tRNA synthetase
LNPHKLRKHIGEVRPATAEEIVAVGAVPGFASAIGIKNALIVVDELIPHSVNLVAGANEEGYHLLNTNYGRDYSADLVVEIVQAQDGDICTVCEDACFYETKGEILVDDQGNFISENILLALAESHHDDKGLTLPAPAAPFDVYLMHIPGKTIDTKAKAEEIYLACQSAGLSVLFDDRDERAGVKFNDADLVGCPVRVTVGERGLKDGMVEVKARKAGENLSVPIFDLVSSINQNS